MASLDKHPTGGYRIRFTIYFPDGSKKTKAKYSRKLAVAKRIKKDAAFLERLTSGHFIRFSDLKGALVHKLITKDEALAITDGEALSSTSWDIIRQDYESYSRTAHTQYNQRTTICRLNNLEKYFKDIPISKITVQEVLTWQSSRIKERKTRTVIHERGLLAKLLDFAIARGAIIDNPARHKLLKGTLKIDKSRIRVSLTYDEVKSLIGAIKDSRSLGGNMELAALFFLFAGLRRGEVGFLTREDFCGEEVIIQGKEIARSETTCIDVTPLGYWNPKSNRSRVITLPPQISSRIVKLLPKNNKRFIFGGDKTYHLDTFSYNFEKILKKINPALSLHCLRHTFVTWRIEHGLTGHGDNLVRVQQAAGHSDILTTMGYTHIKVSPEKNILDLITEG